MNRRSFDTERAATFAAKILAHHWRVFLSDNGTGSYGFFTNRDGSQVVTFQFNGFNASVSGNWRTNKPRENGSGWRIDDNADASRLGEYWQATGAHLLAPGSTCRYTTLAEYLATYGESSKYREVFGG